MLIQEEEKLMILFSIKWGTLWKIKWMNSFIMSRNHLLFEIIINWIWNIKVQIPQQVNLTLKDLHLSFQFKETPIEKKIEGSLIIVCLIIRIRLILLRILKERQYHNINLSYNLLAVSRHIRISKYRDKQFPQRTKIFIMTLKRRIHFSNTS
jgi:hypothetical protein